MISKINGVNPSVNFRSAGTTQLAKRAVNSVSSPVCNNNAAKKLSATSKSLIVAGLIGLGAFVTGLVQGAKSERFMPDTQVGVNYNDYDAEIMDEEFEDYFMKSHAEVKKGDSYWTIAKQALIDMGNENPTNEEINGMTKYLLEFNGYKATDNPVIKPGDVVDIW